MSEGVLENFFQPTPLKKSTQQHTNTYTVLGFINEVPLGYNVSQDMSSEQVSAQITNNTQSNTTNIITNTQQNQQFDFSINTDHSSTITGTSLQSISKPMTISIEDKSQITQSTYRRNRGEVIESFIKDIKKSTFQYSADSPLADSYLKTTSFFTPIRAKKGMVNRLCVSTSGINMTSVVTNESYLMLAPNTQQLNKSLNKNLITFFNEICMATSNQDFFEVLVQFFTNQEEMFGELYKAAVQKKPTLRAIVLNYKSTIVSFYSYIMFQKDKLQISDEIYHEIRIRFFLQHILPDINQQKSIRKEENIEILEKYGVSARIIEVS